MSGFSHALFQQAPVVGILRGLPHAVVQPVVAAVVAGGLKNLEFTMNTERASQQIRAARQLAGADINIGAGTVTSIALLEEAREAGASFIVTPVVCHDVIARCRQDGIPVFPGAFSPSEILQAWELGPTVVKLFPADALGPARFQEIQSSLAEVRLMPTGGVDLATLVDYARAGAHAFGVGTPLFRPERIAAGDWNWLEDQCRAFVRAYQSTRL